MIVEQRRLRLGQYPHGAGHAQMRDRGAAAAAKQQVFAAAIDAFDHLVFQRSR